ncbi:aspartate aminotransferase family protein [Sphingomonas glacialis]|uniref:Aspartate aminotransferase family protein n=2 Tax=Sphingomonas glacialis TaxID=658225 RepID=A0A502FRS8_9SPHN|nr:aspartate aminotransferase family protein [Sphingomonas glacialis]
MATELALYADAARRGAAYLEGVSGRRVFPDQQGLDGLRAFDEGLPAFGLSPESTLALLDESGSPATVATNGPRYFGFVVGAALPAAAAAERLMLAWDQGAALHVASPVSARIEAVASSWLLEVLDLPRSSAVGFGTSSTACGLTCLAAARRSVLLKAGFDLDVLGIAQCPEVKVVVSEKVHVTVLKALRILGFGRSQLLIAPVDGEGRIDLDRLPPLDATTILCLQAGEVNTGEFDPFGPLIARAREAGAWVHVDGAFGLWARASATRRALTEGIDLADSWTVDGHKWLNTPYDCAMAICRDPEALAGAMNSDAAYAVGSADAQKNLTLEFSRRARGIPVWAVLRSLGTVGVAELVDRHCRQALRLAGGLRAAGFEVVNRVVLNQLVVRAADDAQTNAVRIAAERSGELWFGSTSWNGRAAFRLSVSSWRTTDGDIERAIELLAKLLGELHSHHTAV